MFDSYNQQAAQAEQADRMRELEIQGAKDYYAAIESSTMLTKAVTEEATLEAQEEVLRVGAAKGREASLDLQGGRSKLLAASEGITAGRSAGRQMVAYEIEADKAINEIKGETTSTINQLVDQKDKIENDLNMQLLNAWQDMATVLTTPGATVYDGSTTDILMSGIQGGLSGYSSALNLGYSGFTL